MPVLTEHDKFIMGLSPILFVKPVGGVLTDLALSTAIAAAGGALVTGSDGDEFSAGPAGSEYAGGDGAASYATVAALTRFLTRLNGRPFTVIARYSTTQTGAGCIFYQGSPGGAQYFWLGHNGKFPGDNDSNRIGIIMSDGASKFRLFGGFHGGIASDGAPHTHAFSIDPAVAQGSIPIRYYRDGVEVTALNIGTDPGSAANWDAAYAPSAEATEGSMFVRKVGTPADGYFAAKLYMLAIIPTNMTQAMIELEQRVYHGLDKETQYASRVAPLIPVASSSSSLGALTILCQGDSQTALASSGSGDQLNAFGDIRGIISGARRIARCAGTRLMLTRLAFANGFENGADGVTGDAAQNFTSSIPAEIVAQMAQNDNTGKLTYLALQSGWSAGPAVAAGGAVVSHLTQDFPLRADEGMGLRVLLLGAKATAATVTAEIINRATSAVLATGTFNVGGAAVVDADFAWQSTNYWAKWQTLSLAAGAALPTAINGTTPQLLIRFSAAAGPCGVAAYRMLAPGNAGGIIGSLFAAAGGTNTRQHVELLYDTLTLTQIANIIAAETEWQVNRGFPPKLLVAFNLFTNDVNDTTASRNPDGTTNVANPLGNTPAGCYNNTLAIMNRWIAANRLLGRSDSTIGFTNGGTQSWAAISRQTSCGVGQLRALRDNPSINGMYINGEKVSSLASNIFRSAYMSVLSGLIDVGAAKITASATPVITSTGHTVAVSDQVMFENTDSTPPLLGPFVVGAVSAGVSFTLAVGQVQTTVAGTKGSYRVLKDLHLDRSGNYDHGVDKWSAVFRAAADSRIGTGILPLTRAR